MENDRSTTGNRGLARDHDERSGLERRHQPEQYSEAEHRAHLERRANWNPGEHNNAEEQVKAFLSILKEEYGLRPEDLRLFRNDLQWLRVHHKQMETWASWVGYGIVVTIVGGIMLALFEGIKEVLHK